MEYWIKIGFTTAMVFVISENVAAHRRTAQLSCRKPVTNGIECPETHKLCPTIDSCAEPSECPCMDGFISYNDTVGNVKRINCEDIHECIIRKHVCGPYTQCNNTIGGYFCVCNKGFRRENATEFCPTGNRSENECSDIDECKEQPNICGINSMCNNTVGSHKCSCMRGFKNISNNCIVKCKESNVQPKCDKAPLQCKLDMFMDSWTPLCDNSSSLEASKLLDDLEDLISNFPSDEPQQRLKIVGQLLNTVEATIKNLVYLFHEHIPITNEKYHIGAKIIDRASEDGEILLENTKSSIQLDTKTALGNASLSVFGSLEYGNMEELLKGASLQQFQNHSVELVSPVVSVFLGIPDTAKLEQPVLIRFNLSRKVTPNETYCAFWSSSHTWSTEGCQTLEINQNGVVCNCTHLTSFAVLMALKKIESWTLSLITQIGLAISIVCLALAILTFSLCRFLRGPRNTIHIHLCVCLLLGHCIFLLGIEATTNKTLCGIVAGLLHFFYLSSFCWMSLEGLELYLMLITVFKTQVKMRYLLAVGYGVPTVIIVITAAVVPGGYGTADHCWLSMKENVIWSFMGPVCVIILLNCGIFVVTVWKLADKMATINPDQDKYKRLRLLTVTSIAQLCILGCCWAFGFLMFGKATLFFAYAFTICNVLQGLQIFFLHCLMIKRIRETYGNIICAIAHFRSPLYSEFSNSTNANTQSRSKQSKESGL